VLLQLLTFPSFSAIRKEVQLLNKWGQVAHVMLSVAKHLFVITKIFRLAQEDKRPFAPTY